MDSQLYTKSTQYQDLLNSLSRITNRSIYIYDIQNRAFQYVSPNPLFLCGFSVQDAMESGSEFFQKVVFADDLVMMQEIWDATQKKFSQFEEQLRFTTSLTFDYRLNHKSSVITVNQSLTPVSVNDVGQMCLVMCLVSISSQGHPENVFLDCGDDKRWEYSFKLKKWIERKFVSFSDREREVLLLSAQGKSNKEIGELLFIDMTTVKSHKYHLFRKLRSNNICKPSDFCTGVIFFGEEQEVEFCNQPLLTVYDRIRYINSRFSTFIFLLQNHSVFMGFCNVSIEFCFLLPLSIDKLVKTTNR